MGWKFSCYSYYKCLKTNLMCPYFTTRNWEKRESRQKQFFGEAIVVIAITITITMKIVYGIWFTIFFFIFLITPGRVILSCLYCNQLVTLFTCLALYVSDSITTSLLSKKSFCAAFRGYFSNTFFFVCLFVVRKKIEWF